MKKRIPALIAALAAFVPAVAPASEREITVTNSNDGVMLAGTLSMPDSGSPRALLVMATGSGQQDRDEEIFGHKLFRDIADRLAAEGYASIRMDDRGTGGSGGQFKGATVDDFVGDIAAAVAAADTLCHGVPVGVLGHSEGGTVAIRQAAHNPACDFIVTLAASAWQGDSIIMSQTRAVAEAMSGRWEPDKEALQRSLLDICLSDVPTPLARPGFIYILSNSIGEAATLPKVQAQIVASADVMLSDYYRGMVRYNPADDIASITKPWLALNGGKDMQVLPANLTTIQQLNPTVDTMLLPGHNHLFQQCTTGLVQEYATLAESISSATLDAIVAWLDAHFPAK
ncbi:MAG: lysophospholipase [Barnesiella sp.]|nr:lysophospholipase [Barnesiella sp.]